MRNTISTEEIAIIQKFYDEGNSIRDCTKKFGRCGQTLKKYLNKRTQAEASALKNRSRKSKSENVMAWRKRVKIKLVEYKGGKCECCGYNKIVEALQFHHINPSEKDFQISGTSKAFETMKKEVDKCKLLCANCHIETHVSERN
jgi:transposase